MKYKILPLIQGSQEWLDFRKNKIGASDISSILGISPYKKRTVLLQEKITGVSEQISEYTQKIFQEGHDIEEKVREQLKTQGFFYEPIVCQSEEVPEFFCSLDGYDSKRQDVLEVKSTSSIEILNQVINKQVPAIYDAQIQFQLLITGLKNATLVVVDKGDYQTYVLNVEYNPEFASRIFNEAKQFLSEMKQGVAPIQQQQTQVMSQIAETVKVISEYEKIIKEEKEKQKKLGEALLTEFGATQIEGCGLRISWAERKGNVDYDQIEILKTIDLEKYRKPSTRYVKLTVLKEKTK